MIDQDPEGPTVIDQDLERKSTTRMKKPTQRPRELDFNRCCHHLGLISLVCCFCLRGLCFIRKISLVWSLCFCLHGFLGLIFLCLLSSCFGFLYLIFLCLIFVGFFVFLLVCFFMFLCLKFWFLGYLLWNSSLTDSSSMWISQKLSLWYSSCYNELELLYS